MLRRTIILTAAAFCASGCTAGHRVYVNGYSELAEPIEQSAAIFVAVDPNSPNPIFEKQIKHSAETLLRGYGYTVANTPDTADYRARFQVGMKSETVMGYTPLYRPHFGPRGGYPDAFRSGYSTYTPYLDTFYDQWLVLRLSRTGADDSDAKNVVWVGEATLSTDRAELRQTVGYLLIGCIEYLGVDTGRKIAMTIRKDDPRIMGIVNQ